MQSGNRKILSVIIIARFFCTFMWFAGNVVLPDLVLSYNISAATLSYITKSLSRYIFMMLALAPIVGLLGMIQEKQYSIFN